MVVGLLAETEGDDVMVIWTIVCALRGKVLYGVAPANERDDDALTIAVSFELYWLLSSWLAIIDLWSSPSPCPELTLKRMCEKTVPSCRPTRKLPMKATKERLRSYYN